MATVRRLIGVYNADGTVLGELTYFVGARLGRAHCALCDVTHGMVREKAAWRECRDGLGVPFEAFHRDDQPAAVRAGSGGREPVVLAETEDGLVVLLEPAALDACGGSVEQFVHALDRALEQAGLTRSTA